MNNIVRTTLSLILIFGCWGNTVEAKDSFNESTKQKILSLQQKKWAHGSPDCKLNTDPSIEIFQYDKSSYVLRQNKCTNYEAPFIYVLFGSDKILILDTGATESAVDFPLYDTVQNLILDQSIEGEIDERELLVIHSHSHGDHYAGDLQFKDKPNVVVIEPNSAGIEAFFSFSNQEQVEIDLGGRKITAIYSPGHQEEAISIYDSQTQWLLTGDTFYPGYVYVKDWDNYKKSIKRLASFIEENGVSAILGAHIEMTSKAGEYYPIGSTYQADEASLVLMPKDLSELNLQLQKQNESEIINLNGLIVEEMGLLSRTISHIARWILQ